MKFDLSQRSLNSNRAMHSRCRLDESRKGLDEELAKKPLVWKMLWSGYRHVRAKDQCEAKLLHDIADVMGQDGLRINNAQYSFD